MVEQTPHALTKQKEAAKQLRDSLVEKLLEFAIGTQSNAAQGVKCAVS